MPHTSTAVLLVLTLTLAAPAWAGPFKPAAGKPGSDAIAKTDSRLVAWATGWENYSPGANVDTPWRDPTKALGPAIGDAFDIVSLGDKGRITLTFSGTLFNGPGWDFAIFENSFGDTFLELAFVEVSSNGSSFVRFPAFSLTPAPIGAFGAIDPTNIDGFAGKYRQGFGTPFDLDLLKNVPGLDVNAITHIRLVDVKGDGSEFDNWPASLGGPNRIYDPYPTTGSGGFDLDAIGLRYFTANVVLPPDLPPGPVVPPAPVPLPAAVWLLLAPLACIARRRRAPH